MGNETLKSRAQAGSTVAQRLNRNFSGDQSVFRRENLRLIRSIDRPILIDFNNTLVNERRPWFLNPDAEEAVEIAKKAGTIIVVTTNTTDWDLRQGALENFGVWHPEMILMTAKNYTPGNHIQRGRAKGAIKEYLWFNKLLGRRFSPRDFTPFFHQKRIAPVFMKGFDIPLIDDLPENTLDNPGIMGITVRNWTKDSDLSKLPTITYAASLAANYYSQLGLKR